MTGNAAALLILIGIFIGIIGTLFTLWLRDVLREAERWGTSLDLEAAMEEAPWYGLEDVKLRVKPLHDWKRTGEL